MIDRNTHKPFRLTDLKDFQEAIEQLNLDLDIREDISILAKPVEVAGRVIPNSMAVQPMEGCDGTPEGAPGELTIRRYRRFAAGGAGLLWFEACAVVPEGRANPRQLWINERSKDAFASLLKEAHGAARESLGDAHRPFTVLQLTHSGRYSRPGRLPSPIIAQHDPWLDPTRNISPDQPVISDEELAALEDEYVNAARLAFEAGFDAVDVKACHRYLMNELLASHTREGKFGGSYENRTRLIKSIVRRIMAESKGIVTCRLGIHDAHPYPYGWGMDPENPTEPNLEEPKRLVRELHNMGMPLINITMGNPYYNPHVNRPYDRPIEGAPCPEEHPLVGVERLVTLTRQVREGLPNLTVVGSGYSWLRNLWPHLAAAEISRGSVQLVGLGRQSFAHPEFAKEVMETNRLERRHTCISCSSCTQIMRDGGTSGCVPFDKEVYGPIYREGRRNSPEYMRAQASRCRDCFDPTCMDGCPAGVDIPGFVTALADGDIRRSYEILTDRNPLPELCAYVCPAEVQCQGHCIEEIFSGNAVPIRELQLYVARTARVNGWTAIPNPPPTGKRVAIVGAGPAGLACAASLLKLGHSVDVFDPNGKPGGTAASSIPGKRLKSDDFQAEAEAVFENRLNLLKEGLSDARTLDRLTREYDAVFLGLGLGSSPSLADPRPAGVEDAMDFLVGCKAGEASVPERVAVLGGGNTAMDAAVEAVSCGAKDVYLIYRRSFAEMPAWPAERDEALNLGIHFLLLTQPLGYETHDGRVTGVRVARTILGKPDDSGRRRPEVVAGSESVIEVDLVLEALGQRISADAERLLGGLRLSRGLIEVDECGRTSMPKVYAGGDIINGGATVVRAVAEGVRAAQGITADFRAG